jgi:hypothetical protein
VLLHGQMRIELMLERLDCLHQLDAQRGEETE